MSAPVVKQAFTVQEAASAYGVSAEVIRSHIKAGSLAARYPSTRPVIGAEELQEWFTALPSEPAK